MEHPSGVSRKGYPLSLQCAAKAVFGPSEKLNRLLDEHKTEHATAKEQTGTQSKTAGDVAPAQEQ